MTATEIVRRVRVTGRVQGVSFRASCRDEARSRGVTGWVRNRDDGSVEALFAGDPEAVEAMIAWCRSGPSGARVDDLDVAAVEPRELSARERPEPGTPFAVH